jgi:hypothetical protein
MEQIDPQVKLLTVLGEVWSVACALENIGRSSRNFVELFAKQINELSSILLVNKPFEKSIVADPEFKFCLGLIDFYILSNGKNNGKNVIEIENFYRKYAEGKKAVDLMREANGSEGAYWFLQAYAGAAGAL